MRLRLDDLTVVIKTFRRPACLAAAIADINRFWPGTAEVVVLDDGPPHVQVPTSRYYRLIRTEEDIGLSEGRNRLVDAVDTPLVALFDDDFRTGPWSRLDVLAAAVRSGHCDVIGAAIREAEGFWNGGWVYRRDGRALHKLHGARSRRPVVVDGAEVELYSVDQVNNAFVASTEFLRRVRWDPQLKLREHDDFALRSSVLGRIAYTPSGIVDHVPLDPPGYKEIRNDTHRYHAYFLAKWNIDAVIKETEWARHSPDPPRPKILT